MPRPITAGELEQIKAAMTSFEDLQFNHNVFVIDATVADENGVDLGAITSTDENGYLFEVTQ